MASQRRKEAVSRWAIPKFSKWRGMSPRRGPLALRINPPYQGLCRYNIEDKWLRKMH